MKQTPSIIKKLIITSFLIITACVQIVHAQIITIWNEYSWNNTTSRAALDTDANIWKSSFASWSSFSLLEFWTSNIDNIISWNETFYAWTSAVNISLRDMNDISNNSSLWIQSTSTVKLEASITMQDWSPKPQSLYTAAAPFWLYRNELWWSGTSRNAILFEFLNWVWGFWGWFGDVETRTIGWWTPAEIRLLSSTWSIITGSIIQPTVSDQLLCGSPINDSFAGCGNRTSRFIWFNNSIWLDIRYMLVIVWDDDTTAWSNNGNTEHLSFIGGFSTPVQPIVEIPTFQCTWAIPSDATLCIWSNTWLTLDTFNNLTLSCSSNKCEYLCNSWFELSGSSCQPIILPTCWNESIETWESCDQWTWNWIICNPIYWSSCNYCNAICQNTTLAWWFCWDGMINGSETCDDHNIIIWDGCSAVCEAEIPPILTWCSLTSCDANPPIFAQPIAWWSMFIPIPLPEFPTNISTVISGSNQVFEITPKSHFELIDEWIIQKHQVAPIIIQLPKTWADY